VTAKARHRAASRPAPRTVDVVLESGPFAGWSCTARADFPARILADLQSGSVDRITTALGKIVLVHNMPGEDGEPAADIADVDPYDGMLAIAGAVFDRLAKLPNR
jgi:hypothetical protein